jgi:hypothetical protein
MAKKITTSLLLAALLLAAAPLPARAIGEALTQSSETTANWCAVNYPVVSLLPNSGLYCDLLVMRDSLQQLIALYQKLAALRAQLQALLSNQSNQPPPATEPPSDGDPGTITTNLRRVKIEAFTDKSGYDPGNPVTVTVRASKREDGPSTVQFINTCEAKYSLFKDGATTAVYSSYFNQQACAAVATTTYNLPKIWTMIHNQTAYPLAAGSYRLQGEVTGYHTADWYFTIRKPGAPSITMTNPTLNQQWATSSSQTVTWTTTNAGSADQVDILLMSNATNEQWSLGRVANDGTETVTVLGTLAPGSYTLMLRVTVGGNIANSITVQIVIPTPTSEPVTPPFIQSVTPSSGLAGSPVVIVGLNFLENNNQLVFGTSTLSNLSAIDGRITVNVPGLSTGLHGLRVTNTNGNSNTVNFIVTAPMPNQPTPTATTTIVVTYPNGGETLTIGATSNITWTSNPTSSNGGATAVNIRVIHNDTNLTQDIAKNVPNSGTYAWSVGRLADGSILAAGNKYRIRICPVTAGDCDKSDNNVILVSGTAGKTSDAGNPQLAATAVVLNHLLEQLNALLRLY